MSIMIGDTVRLSENSPVYRRVACPYGKVIATDPSFNEIKVEFELKDSEIRNRDSYWLYFEDAQEVEQL